MKLITEGRILLVPATFRPREEPQAASARLRHPRPARGDSVHLQGLLSRLDDDDDHHHHHHHHDDDDLIFAEVGRDPDHASQGEGHADGREYRVRQAVESRSLFTLLGEMLSNSQQALNQMIRRPFLLDDVLPDICSLNNDYDRLNETTPRFHVVSLCETGGSVDRCLLSTVLLIC